MGSFYPSASVEGNVRALGPRRQFFYDNTQELLATEGYQVKDIILETQSQSWSRA